MKKNNANRQQRRAADRAKVKAVRNVVRNHDEKLGDLNQTATVKDVLDIASALVSDKLIEYHKQNANLQIQLTVHAELARTLMIDKGLITEEEYNARVESYLEQFNKETEERLKSRPDEVVAASPQDSVPAQGSEKASGDGLSTVTPE